MGVQKDVYRISFGFLCCFCIFMIFLWDFLGISIIFLLDSYEISMRLLWDLKRISMVFL